MLLQTFSWPWAPSSTHSISSLKFCETPAPEKYYLWIWRVVCPGEMLHEYSGLAYCQAYLFSVVMLSMATCIMIPLHYLKSLNTTAVMFSVLPWRWYTLSHSNSWQNIALCGENQSTSITHQKSFQESIYLQDYWHIFHHFWPQTTSKTC